MCVIGVGMMMETMVSVLMINSHLLFWLVITYFHLPLGVMQWYYFAQGSMRTVVHSQGMCGPILRVSYQTFSFRTDFWRIELFVNEFTRAISTAPFSFFFLIFKGGGFNISPLKPRNGKPRTQVQHLMQIDLKGWGVGYLASFQQHCLLQMLNTVAGRLFF